MFAHEPHISHLSIDDPRLFVRQRSMGIQLGNMLTHKFNAQINSIKRSPSTPSIMRTADTPI